MSRVLRFSLGLLALLVVSLGPKMLMGNTVLVPDAKALEIVMAERMQARGLARQASPARLVAYIDARQGACRMIAMNMDSEGHLVTWFANRTASLGPATYHYRTSVGRDFPRLWPPIETFVQQSGFRLGLNVPRAPVIAVAASSACGTAVDWSGLQIRGQRQTRRETGP